MRTVRLLIAAIMAVTGLVAVGATTEAANASSKDLVVNHVRVMKNEALDAYGRLGTHLVRRVWLQYRYHTDDAWKTLSATSSDVNGNYNFYSAYSSTTRYYRYYAPASAGHPSITGNAKKISVVAQKVNLFFITPSTQCQGSSGSVTAVASFYPARSGRIVTFTSNTGTKFGYEDSMGNVAVTFSPGSAAFSFASVATATPFQGASPKNSSVFTYGIAPCAA
ncbi:MAG: hypothetical protein JWR83_2877 [Aeromicrobium sp.]|nr:hypothetical protein [Aeromicrobium sp.]